MLLVVLMATVSAERAWSHENAGAKETESEWAGGLLCPLMLFRNYISAVDGDRCPMTPSCSRYSLDAFHKHGVVMGWIMTSDRLMRCGRDELAHTGSVRTGGTIFSLDPVENNDFWLPDRGSQQKDTHAPDFP